MLFPKNYSPWIDFLKLLIKKAERNVWQDHVGRAVFIFAVVSMLVYLGVFISPAHFPKNETTVSIKEGMGLREVANVLKKESLIRSRTAFQIVVILIGGERNIKHGDYGFERRQNTIEIAWRLRNGKFDIEPRRVFIPEGATVREISILAGEKLHNFDRNKFIELSRENEGYLFPDTYFFLPSDDAFAVRTRMLLAFTEKMGPFMDKVRESGHSLHEIVTMASIIEEEAKTPDARRIISGILWKRIELGVPLQVDATFLYINGKNTFDLTLEDLRIDNPYNTYKYKGLPPGPISNPGMDAILAALEPIKTPYLYYLSDLDGNMHYGKTFEEHKVNKAKYLP